MNRDEAIVLLTTDVLAAAPALGILYFLGKAASNNVKSGSNTAAKAH